MRFIIQANNGKGKYLMLTKSNTWRKNWWFSNAYKFKDKEMAEEHRELAGKKAIIIEVIK
jgi:hypothetical protein